MPDKLQRYSISCSGAEIGHYEHQEGRWVLADDALSALDAEWNAAIETAANYLDDNECEILAYRIRDLKREVKP